MRANKDFALINKLHRNIPKIQAIKGWKGFLDFFEHPSFKITDVSHVSTQL